MMKPRLFACLCALLAAVPAVMEAQNVTYSLPRTTITLEVDAVQESFFAGPYAAYAKKYLGIQVLQKDAVRSYLREVRLLTKVEADPAERYSADIKGAEERFLALSSQGLVSFQDKIEAGSVVWRFDPQPITDLSNAVLIAPTRTEVRTVWKEEKTDTSATRTPVQETFELDKTPEMMAQEAAKIILKAREERFNISTGNTDATFSGEALGAALAELDRVEKEYLALFTGYTVTREQKGSFDIIPSAEDRKFQYVAFRLSDKDGLVADGAGSVYYLELSPETVSDGGIAAKDARNVIHCRIPAICDARLILAGRTLLQTRVPVYQLGYETTFPAK